MATRRVLLNVTSDSLNSNVEQTCMKSMTGPSFLRKKTVLSWAHGRQWLTRFCRYNDWMWLIAFPFNAVISFCCSWKRKRYYMPLPSKSDEHEPRTICAKVKLSSGSKSGWKSLMWRKVRAAIQNLQCSTSCFLPFS